MVERLYKQFIEPRSTDEDSRRREFILNILLLGSLVLSFAALLVILINLHLVPDATRISRFYIVSGVFTFFLILYWLSRIRFYSLAAYILVGTYFLLGTYTLYTWGITIPQGPLVYALVVVMAGILIGTRFAFLALGLMAVSLLTIGYSHTHAIVTPNLDWTGEVGGIPDAIGFIFSIGIIALISWLSNREIEKSLARARKSEAALQKERDLLEVRVEERTQELKRAQLEKISELSKFSEIGQMAAGIIHDLANPLATVSFSLEQINEKERSELVDRALKGTEYMKRFINSARKQMQRQDNMSVFSLAEEIEDVMQMGSYRAKSQNVEIKLQRKSQPKTYGNSSRFDQLIANLLSNAIDAYATSQKPKDDRKIRLLLEEAQGKVHITVEDWAGGIPKGLQAKIFEPFFTTKGPDKGTGIGLSTAKTIVEKDFSGTITFSSVEGQGTKFMVVLPLKAPPT